MNTNQQKNIRMLSIVVSVLIVLTMACGLSAQTEDASPTIDTQATVNAAVGATATAEAFLQATVNSAVAATATLIPPTPTPGPTEEYIYMTEEELNALIEQAVNDAVAATSEASTQASQATSDTSMTSEEVETVEVYVTGAEEAIAYAEELIAVYYDLYGELATESLELLIAVEDDLNEMASYMATLAQVLVEIEEDMSQGLALAEETISQVTETAEAAAQQLNQVQNQVHQWVADAQVDRENRANQVLNIKPDNIPADLQATILSAFDFVDLVRGSLEDQKISRDELNRIAQLSANVSAGFERHGGSRFQGFSGKVNDITASLARGQNRQAREGLGNFERSLGERPSKPSGPNLKPGGLIPNRP